MEKSQRIRDYVHNLIVFDSVDETVRLAWSLINTREFQRLRRIRQLGLSEFVFPGATHTRFSHCVGVYHTARRLLGVIKKKTGTWNENRAKTAAIAALLHDVGHGPFSHVFEEVEKALGRVKHHETWSTEIINGDTQIHEVLDKVDPHLAGEVAQLLSEDHPSDIYSSVVSSQFDADRLDFLRRDRYMTGTGAGHFDFEWLIDCLEIDKITSGQGDDYVVVDGFYLNHKGLMAAESYLLARFHMYSQVYFHKTTRAAEQMLEALLVRTAGLAKDNQTSEIRLAELGSLGRFWSTEHPSLAAYLALDDNELSAAIAVMEDSSDPAISELAVRLRNRKLYKCLDVGARVVAREDDTVQRFLKRIKDEVPAEDLKTKVLVDADKKISAYGQYEWSEEALEKVLVKMPGKARPQDIAGVSDVVKYIPKEKVIRIYASEGESQEQVNSIWREVDG